jgi:hypothetical protein
MPVEKIYQGFAADIYGPDGDIDGSTYSMAISCKERSVYASATMSRFDVINSETGTWGGFHCGIYFYWKIVEGHPVLIAPSKTDAFNLAPFISDTNVFIVIFGYGAYWNVAGDCNFQILEYT